MPNLTARAGLTLRASTGLEFLGEPDRMSTILFYHAKSGDRLTLLDKSYLFNVATYAPEVDPQYIYTYSYQPNQSWTRYNGDLSGDTYRTDDYYFASDCYFRLCFKRADGADFTDAEADAVNDIISFEGAEAVCTKPEFISQEAARILPQIKRHEGSYVFALMTDTHLVVNGTWEDTLASLREVNAAKKFDGVIHLGDMTDGMVTAKATRENVRYIKDGLRSLGCPLYIAIGNHDCNYFGKNSEPFSIEEQRELYLGHLAQADKPWYFIDYPGLRMIFLHSYDRAKRFKYGYSAACLDWLEQTLTDTPEGQKVLVFSHLTLLTRLQVWTPHIRGGERLVRILKRFNKGGGRVLAYINGHNHADHTDMSLGFPVISVGCAKTEYFLEHKPHGSVTPARKLGDRTQELWDVLIVTPGEGRVERVRFGADRME